MGGYNFYFLDFESACKLQFDNPFHLLSSFLVIFGLILFIPILYENHSTNDAVIMLEVKSTH